MSDESKQYWKNNIYISKKRKISNNENCDDTFLPI
jgi:hypothetical protein